MNFVKRFIRNIAVLAVAGVFLYLLFPQLMGPGYQLMWGILGPLAILVLLVAAIPGRR